MKAQDIELLAGVSLSDGGISLPLHTVLRKRPFRITMKTPTTRSLIRISKRYLRIGVTPEESGPAHPVYLPAWEGYQPDGGIRNCSRPGTGKVTKPPGGMDASGTDDARRTFIRLATNTEQYIYHVFRDYYRIGSSTEQDAALSEPERERKRNEELKKGHTEPSHSLFGVVGQLATETGWSIDYILDKVNVVTLQMMMADMPHWVPPQKPDMMQQIREMEEREKQRNSHKQTDNTNTTKGMNPMEFFTKYAVKD